VWLAVSLGQSNGRVEIMLSKLSTGTQWTSLGVAGQLDGAWVNTSTEGESIFIRAVEVSD